MRSGPRARLKLATALLSVASEDSRDVEVLKKAASGHGSRLSQAGRPQLSIAGPLLCFGPPIAMAGRRSPTPCASGPLEHPRPAQHLALDKLAQSVGSAPGLLGDHAAEIEQALAAAFLIEL